MRAIHVALTLTLRLALSSWSCATQVFFGDFQLIREHVEPGLRWKGVMRKERGKGGLGESWSSDGAGLKKKGAEEVDPPLFPAPLAPLKELPDPEEATVELITRHRDVKERFRNLPTVLKFPAKGFDVQRYSGLTGASNADSGCTSLPQVLTKPLPDYHFPEELHAIIQPAKASESSESASRKRNASQRFKRKITIDLNKLEAIEKRAKEKKEDDGAIERKMSIVSDTSLDEDGDYGINHYESEGESQPEGQEEATF